jgi:hypothetical protein
LKKILLLAFLAGLVNLGSTLGAIAQGSSSVTAAQWYWVIGAFVTAFAKDLQSLFVVPPKKELQSGDSTVTIETKS